MGRKGVLVCLICRDPAGRVCSFFVFSHYVAARDALQTQNVEFGNETQHSSIFLVRLQTAQANPTDSTFKFNSL